MKLDLAYYIDPVLRQVAKRVDCIDDSLRQLVEDMIETVHIVKGVGLAAPQVHHSIRLFVTCVPYQNAEGKWQPGKDRVFINPEVLNSSAEMETCAEGCLSIPKIYIKVARPKEIVVRATGMDGQTFQETLSGFFAANFLHENDHLNGVLITDHLGADEREGLKQLLKENFLAK